MGDDLLVYIERLELIAFFAGYPLVYASVLFFAGAINKKYARFASNLTRLLPFGYALCGSLFLGLVLRELATVNSIKALNGHFQNPYLVIWGLLSILFWIPAFSRKPVFSLLHSIPFFALFLRDVFRYMNDSPELLKNAMKIYTDSLLLNTGTLICILVFQYILWKINRRNRSTLK